jgi:ABC-type Fe3+/spermidine/putrescine transport system ATPase subunit
VSPHPALTVHELHVRRGSKSGVFELRVEALALEAGGVLAVLGPNGAGKSTLLRSLAGLEPVLAGRIERRVDGPVAMVFQRPVAFSGSVLHNLRVALSGQRLSRREARVRVDEALDHFGIAALASRRAATLSGGELRRLALARAFALRPAVLLLDEPFDALDAAGQEALTHDLRRAIAGSEVAVAVVTHDLRRALLLADRVAVLLEGRLAQQGAREEVLARPATPAVARLVGMSNLIPGVLHAAAGELASVFVDEQHAIAVESAPDASLAPGAAVWAGIRPERLKLDVGRGEGLPIGKGVVRSVVSDGVAASVGVAWAGLVLGKIKGAGFRP